MWQQAITCCSCYRMPQNAFFFFLFSTKSRSFGQPKKRRKDTFFPTRHSLSSVFLQLHQWWHLYCFAILGSTSIVIHSVKQRLLRNRPGSDAATSRDFLQDYKWHSLVQTSFTESPNIVPCRQPVQATSVEGIGLFLYRALLQRNTVQNNRQRGLTQWRTARSSPVRKWRD